MQITLNFTVLLLGIIISSSFFATGLLWFSSQNKQSNRFLALLIFTITLWLIDHFLRIADIYGQNANLYFLPIFYSFAFGPLIYFYVKSLVNQLFIFQKKDFLHFIPVVFQAGLYLFLTTKNYDFKNWYWMNVHQFITYKIEFDGTFISMLIYLVLSIQMLKNYQIYVVNNFSETSKIRLNWLKIILIILVVLCVQWLIEIILRDFFNLYFNYDYSVQILGIMALTLAIGGIRQANLSEVNFEEEIAQKSHIQVDNQVLQQIKLGMDSRKLYLNPTLTLAEFARELKLNPKTISQQINTGLGKSFNDFVNEYRVEEVKLRLNSPDLERLTILGIAYESGFNSKTTFNRIFKDFTGLAPRDFLK
ncbi:MAG: helix-turn-helix domain-containing protein [Arcicella sp.]|nr:helix-turn-helix domain-containing protein [Arcicella sp.]